MDRQQLYKHAKRIARQLNEKQKRVVIQIQNIIEAMGLDYTEQKLAEALQIEADGGMMIRSGKRRRTPGGVFFLIVKQSLSDEMREKLFPPKDWRAIQAKRKARKQAARAAAEQVETAEQQQPVEPQSEQPEAQQPEIQEAHQLVEEPQPEPQPPEEEIDLSSMSEEERKLYQLETTAKKLRERIKTMEASKQKGIKMTRTLLENTERQIAKLKETV